MWTLGPTVATSHMPTMCAVGRLKMRVVAVVSGLMIQRWSSRPFAGPPFRDAVARPLLACCWVLEILRPPDFPYVDFQEMNALSSIESIAIGKYLYK